MFTARDEWTKTADHYFGPNWEKLQTQSVRYKPKFLGSLWEDAAKLASIREGRRMGERKVGQVGKRERDTKKEEF